MISAILSDFFGVIYPDVGWDWYRVNPIEPQEEFSKRLLRFDRGEISLKELDQELRGAGGRSPVEDMSNAARLRGEVIDLYRSLHPMRIAIGSNGNRAWVEDILTKDGVRDVFSEIIASSDLRLVKPQTEFFFAAAERIGARPQEILFIDDREENVAGAREAGLAGIIFTSPQQLARDLRGLGLITDQDANRTL
jgi:HAD superfamily hydrolase (TIGR01509 family)